MAQSDDQERTEDPTPKRLREAREKGQVARSKEWNTVAVLLAAATSFVIFGDAIVGDMLSLFKANLTISREVIFDPSQLFPILSGTITFALWMLAPLFTVLFLAALFAPIAIGGLSFSGEVLSFKFDKLNPIKGIGNLFGVRSLMELVKAMAKVSLVGVVAFGVLLHYKDELIGLGSESFEAGMAHFGSMYVWAFIYLSASILFVAAIDVPFQLWQHHSQLKMTKQEVRDEMKETEGKPEVKSKIRQLQREMSQRRMMQNVPKADVIVTNPTHFAVALQYADGKMRAPKVLAKGADLLAAQIRGIAQAHGIAIYEAPPLARALYYTTEIDQEIPDGLYVAVAQVLAYIFQLRAYRRRGGHKPREPKDLPVPAELYEGKSGIRH